MYGARKPLRRIGATTSTAGATVKKQIPKILANNNDFNIIIVVFFSTTFYFLIKNRKP